MASVPAHEWDESFEPEDGGAGASLEREYRRRKHARERRATGKHPRIGRLLLAVSDEPQHQRAFQAGARGERTVAQSIKRCLAESASVVLHNRRMPGGRGDIDHIVVTPSGLYVVDTKAVTGKVRIEKPLLGEPKLLVNGRDRTNFIDGLDRQVSAVADALSDSLPEGTAVQGVLCFTQADLPFLMAQTLRGHLLLYQRGLRKKLSGPGPLPAEAIRLLARRLAEALPAV